MINKILTVIILITSINLVAQVSKMDSILMNKTIRNFRKNINTPFFIVNRTISTAHESWVFFDGKEAIPAFKNKIPKNNLLEILKGIDTLKPLLIPKFTNGILVDRFSEEVQRLQTDIDANSGDDIKYIEQMQKQRTEKLKNTYKAEELQVFRVSEPKYDKSKQNSLIYILVDEIGEKKLYIIYFKLIKDKWEFIEQIFAPAWKP